MLTMGLHELKKPTATAQELPTISENIYSIAMAMESHVSVTDQLGSRSYPFYIWWVVAQAFSLCILLLLVLQRWS